MARGNGARSVARGARGGAGTVVALLAVCAGLVAWGAALRTMPPSSRVDDLPNVAATLSAAAFVVAGVLRLGLWRITGECDRARSGIALILLGCVVPAAPLVGPLLFEPHTYASDIPSVRMLALTAIFMLLLPGNRSARLRTGQPVPAWFAVWVAAASSAAVTLLLLARALLAVPQARLVAVAAAAVATVGWLAVGHRRLTEVRRPMVGILAGAYALLAGAELLRAWVATGAEYVSGLAPAVDLAAAVLLVCAVGAELRSAYGRQAAAALDLSHTVRQLQQELDDAERVQRTRLHDANNAVLGVMGATHLLTGPGPGSDALVLGRLMTEELGRLQALLRPDEEPFTTFDIAPVLAPVIATHRLRGTSVRTHLEDVAVLGRERATATALDNLLRNCMIHAPGARVTVCAARCAGGAIVVVEDDGPGIAPGERGQLMRPGARGNTAVGPGDGLGLPSVASSIRAQGGHFQLLTRPGGGLRVAFTLPLAEARRDVALAG